MGDLFTAITNGLRSLLLGAGVPAAAVPWVFAAARAFVLGVSGLTLVIFLIWFERKVIGRMQDRIGPNRVGPYGLLQTVADMIKLSFKEDLVPPKGDWILFHLAPILAVVGVVGLWAVIPIAATAYGADLNVGVLYLVAAGTLSTLGILMAGWSSDNKFALLGAFRTVAQLVSYEVPMVLALLLPVILAGTLSLNGIISGQGAMWYVVSLPLAAAVFLVASLAEVARAPFELLEAESEIVAGFHIEYSGIRFGMFFAAEFLHAFTIGALLAVLFLGGWQGPGAAQYPTLGAAYFVAKSFLCYFLLVWARATFPRIRIDQMLNFCWTVLTPMMLILVCAVVLVNRALADYAIWLRTAALLGANVVVGFSTLALLGRRLRRAHPPPARKRGDNGGNRGMTVEQILFLVLAAAGLGLAIATVALRNLVRSAFALIGCLFVVAAFYAMLDASLLAAAQVVVYIGAIATLIVLVVMLTRRELQDRSPQAHRYWPAAALLGAAAFAGIAWGLSHYVFFNAAPPPLPKGDLIVELGGALVDPARFLIPFEAVSILLLSALVGAVLVAGGTKEKDR